MTSAPEYSHVNYERMILISTDEYAKLQDCKRKLNESTIDDSPLLKIIWMNSPLLTQSPLKILMLKLYLPQKRVA